ncbi:MAG: GNAT family N-acetyltransferase [Solirubrobacteraceae bacterium]
MNFVELGRLTSKQYDELGGGDQDLFRREYLGLHWQDKERYFVLCDCDGRALAAAGLVVVDVEVVPHEPFAVAGIGDVIVAKPFRGQGLARMVVGAAIDHAKSVGLEIAMLFCDAGMVGLYERLNFIEIDPPIYVEQPAGSMQIPMRSMWRAVREGASWPVGTATLRGLPF